MATNTNSTAEQQAQFDLNNKISRLWHLMAAEGFTDDEIGDIMDENPGLEIMAADPNVTEWDLYEGLMG